MKKLLTVLVCAALGAVPAFAQELVPTGPRDFCPLSDPGLTIRFSLPAPATVSLTLNDPFSGQPIRTLLDDDTLDAGTHQVVWDGSDESGELLDVQPFQIRLIAGGALADDDWGSIQCGYDLGTPTREKAGQKDVTLGIYAAVPGIPDVELAIYETDGTTLVAPLYSGAGSNVIGILWTPNDAPGAPLAAGDYLCRLTSSIYSEDLVFYMDPVASAGMTVVLSDGDGNLVAGIDPLLGDAQVYGPLSEAWIEFDRALSAPEFEYLQNGGLRFYGNFRQAGPAPMAVSPDSMSLHIPSFSPALPWKDLLGNGLVSNRGMLIPNAASFRFGYHQTGVTGRSETCASLGVTDPADWQVTEEYNVEPPCPNPVAPGGVTSFGFGLMNDEYCLLRIFDEAGRSVRTLVQGDLGGGYHTVQWDLLDNSGVPVPDGLYHLVWNTYDPQTGLLEVITSGEIQVWSAVPVGDDPFVRAVPRLEGNHPNPFNPSTTIAFELPHAAPVFLRVYDISGALITTLLDGEVRDAGPHEVVWNGRDAGGRSAASGTYFYRLETEGFGATKRAVLLK